MLSNDYKRKVCCMAAGAPAAFCRTSRRGFASPQSARSSLHWIQQPDHCSSGPPGLVRSVPNLADDAM